MPTVGDRVFADMAACSWSCLVLASVSAVKTSEPRIIQFVIFYEENYVVNISFVIYYLHPLKLKRMKCNSKA